MNNFRYVVYFLSLNLIITLIAGCALQSSSNSFDLSRSFSANLIVPAKAMSPFNSAVKALLSTENFSLTDNLVIENQFAHKSVAVDSHQEWTPFIEVDGSEVHHAVKYDLVFTNHFDPTEHLHLKGVAWLPKAPKSTFPIDYEGSLQNQTVTKTGVKAAPLATLSQR